MPLKKPRSAAPAQSLHWSLPRGRLLRRTLRADSALEYSVYVSTKRAIDAPVLVFVHGLSRIRNEHAAAFVSTCEEHGVTLLAPNFSGEQHTDYQRLGREGRGPRADLFLHRCLQELSSLTGADTTQVCMVGHSAGAQFVHRYLMAYPHRVARAAVIGAGWYTFPDPQLKYPYGIRPSRRLPGVVFDPEAYLRVPVTAIVGADDDGAHPTLRKSDRVNTQQGQTRVARARNWVAAMRAQAAAYRIASQVNLIELRGAGHAFADLDRDGALVATVFRALFSVSVASPRKQPTLHAETAAVAA